MLTMSSMKAGLATVLLALVVCLGAGAAYAQDRGLMPETIIQAFDYDSFVVAGPRGGRACAEACANDQRCQAWTFIRGPGQCRLKYGTGPVQKNACCISGIKPPELVADVGGKPGFCADYAKRAIVAQNQNLSQACRLSGSRWTPDFQAHYGWCMGVDRRTSQVETDARTAEIARCTVTATDETGPKCDHYVRVSSVQIETARKANCALVGNDRLWVGDAAKLKDACQRAPGRVLSGDIAQRESLLATCFAAAGQSEQACGTYADTAVKQVQQATRNECGFAGRTWTSSRAQHLQWCLDASPVARKTEADTRVQQLAACSLQVARRKACDEYAQGATQQAVSNDTQNCGFAGANWSRYADDHVAYCMQANETQLRGETSKRDTALQQCQARNYVNPECDEYARRSVRVSQINSQRQCEYEGPEWSLNYQDHYRFCTRNNLQERRDVMIMRRQALRACSTDRGFTLELGF
jgi:hypothetical protein